MRDEKKTKQGQQTRGNQHSSKGGKGKGTNKPNTKPQTQEKSNNPDDIVRNSANNIAYWNKHPQLLRDAANVSYANLLGLPINLGTTLNEVTDSSNNVLYASLESKDVSLPGIMKINLVPAYGTSYSGNSDMNNAGRLLFSFVRHANSGSRNYEQSDLLMYVLSVDSLYICYAEMARLYGIYRTYSNVNRYIAKDLITALGYDYDDIARHLPDLRYYINQFAVKINSFAVPSKFDIYPRHMDMCANVFKDSNEDKSQLYITQFTHVYEFSGTQFETGSALLPRTTPWTTSVSQVPCTFTRLTEFCDNLINGMMSNEDLGIMSGDILKAFGSDNLFRLMAIPEEFAVLPVYNQGMLSQIHHASVAGRLVTSNPSDGAITQNNNVVYFRPIVGSFSKLVGNAKAAQQSYIIDAGVSNPTPEYNMEATRLMCTLKPLEASTQYQYVESCGTEFVSTMEIYYRSDLTGESTLRRIEASSGVFVHYDDEDASTDGYLLLIFKGMFDWAPIFYGYLGQGPSIGESNYWLLPIGEIFNYAVVSKPLIEKLHTVALLSVLSIPGLGANS